MVPSRVALENANGASTNIDPLTNDRPTSPSDYGVFFPDDMRAYFQVADADHYDHPFEFTRSKFHGWSKRGMFGTSIADWAGRRSYGSFGALITSRMVSLLRARGISMQRVRKAHDFLRSITGRTYPFAAQPIWTDAVRFPKHVYASIESDPYAADLFGQLIFPQLIEIERVHDAKLQFIATSSEADHSAEVAKWHIAPDVIIDPRTQGGVPCVKGRRLPTSVLRANYESGVSIPSIGNLYNVEEVKIEAALKWEHRLAGVRSGAVA